jgi:hypothetical protein
MIQIPCTHPSAALHQPPHFNLDNAYHQLSRIAASNLEATVICHDQTICGNGLGTGFVSAQWSTDKKMVPK